MKGWEDYVPPKDRGEGERAMPRGAARPGGSPGGDGGPGSPIPAPAAPKGRARLTGHKICYVNADATQIVEAGDAKRAGLDKKKQEWVRFHSIHEAKRWVYLKGQERAGKVRNLRRQVKFPLLVTRPDGLKEQIATWTCDFDYERVREHAGGTAEALADVLLPQWVHVTEDAKGFRTEIYKRSKAHWEAQHGRSILET